MISPGTKLATTTDNFEDFFFDFSFKGGIEFVSEATVVVVVGVGVVVVWSKNI
jgi:hypothetical protein